MKTMKTYSNHLLARVLFLRIILAFKIVASMEISWCIKGSQ